MSAHRDRYLTRGYARRARPRMYLLPESVWYLPEPGWQYRLRPSCRDIGRRQNVSSHVGGGICLRRPWGIGLVGGRLSGQHRLHRHRDITDEHPDDGSVTVLAAVAAFVCVLIAALVSYLGAAALARHRAAAAADFAALAAATQILSGDPCSQAGALAAANGAKLVECKVSGLEVRAVVHIEVRIGPISATAIARARAGPQPAQTSAQVAELTDGIWSGKAVSASPLLRARSPPQAGMAPAQVPA